MWKPRAVLPATLALSLLSTAALAAPVSRSVDVELSLVRPGTLLADPGCPGCGPHVLTARGSGTVSVDPIAKTIGLPAGLATLASPFVGVTIVGDTTAIASVSATRLSPLAGTFSIGGAAGIAAESPCPSGGPAAGVACVGQSGFGGALGVTGTYNLVIVAGAVTIPLNLGDARMGLGGPASPAYFSADAAPWTVGTARIGLSTYGGGTTTTQRSGAIGADTLSLVSPTRITSYGLVVPVFAELEVTFTDGLGVPDFVASVPEPAAPAMLGAAGLALLAARRRRRRGCRA
jgi:MYXO-CTERM domain-containing protein